MKKYTGYEYLLIDIANQAGLDKETFETRIQWVKDNMAELENHVDKAGKDAPLFIKAVMALRATHRGKKTGHIMGLDACSSGLQIMGALMGCEVTARNTGLINPEVRADMYTTTTRTINELLAAKGIRLNVRRSDVKTAQMTHFYGSVEEPKNVFGDNTEELKSFYAAQEIVAPGACELMNDLLDTWQPYALLHEWKLPDGFHTRVKVMQENERKVEIDELFGAVFHHYYTDNKGKRKGVSNAANIIHSVDGYIVREMGRRCTYCPDTLTTALEHITDILADRTFIDYKDLDRTEMISLVLAEEPSKYKLSQLSTNTLVRLRCLIHRVMTYRSFPVLSVHDEFRAGPNNMNRLRMHYTELLAELADSHLIENILNQIHGNPAGRYTRVSEDLGDKIRKSNYALS